MIKISKTRFDISLYRDVNIYKGLVSVSKGTVLTYLGIEGQYTLTHMDMSDSNSVSYPIAHRYRLYLTEKGLLYLITSSMTFEYFLEDL